MLVVSGTWMSQPQAGRADELGQCSLAGVA